MMVCENVAAFEFSWPCYPKAELFISPDPVTSQRHLGDKRGRRSLQKMTASPASVCGGILVWLELCRADFAASRRTPGSPVLRWKPVATIARLAHC